ncbi:hypothetical protein BCR44DRAFT_322803 [Catenaria anguillulae PL171]|uniref:Uncharacterized protein n=1 Tax=Catenaria anguillulae PL171 TaxID=765915 RepID=A0A1Y2HAL7_9FUNG|nr:hypothetical protein BCR44DRAFT_322803 [Catenaria anguillulae PL171]
MSSSQPQASEPACFKCKVESSVRGTTHDPLTNAAKKTSERHPTARVGLFFFPLPCPAIAPIHSLFVPASMMMQENSGNQAWGSLEWSTSCLGYQNTDCGHLCMAAPGSTHACAQHLQLLKQAQFDHAPILPFCSLFYFSKGKVQPDECENGTTTTTTSHRHTKHCLPSEPLPPDQKSMHTYTRLHLFSLPLARLHYCHMNAPLIREQDSFAPTNQPTTTMLAHG